MTIKDIAAKCGVSVSTVSRVLNNHPYVKDDVREKVLRVIDEEHFVPHNGAVDLVKPQTDAIGLIVRGTNNQFFNEIISIIESEIDASDYAFVTRQIKEEDDELRAAAAFAKEKKLKGVIFLGGRYDWTVEETSGLNIPFVCCTFSNRFGDRNNNRYSSVGIDDKEEAYRAVKTLLDYGHKKIAILLPSTTDHSVSELRYEGYCQALKDAGIKVDPKLVRESGDYGMHNAYRAVEEMMREKIDFTALFSISDYMAIAAMKAIADSGKSVPDDYSLIAIDGLELSRYTIPTLTTLVQPIEEIASSAVEILNRMIDGKSKSAQFVLCADLREGGSIKARASQ